MSVSSSTASFFVQDGRLDTQSVQWPVGRLVSRSASQVGHLSCRLFVGWWICNKLFLVLLCTKLTFFHFCLKITIPPFRSIPFRYSVPFRRSIPPRSGFYTFFFWTFSNSMQAVTRNIQSYWSGKVTGEEEAYKKWGGLRCGLIAYA